MSEVKSSLSAEDDLPDWVDHFLPGPNINPHDDPAYDEPYVKCESSYSCPDPARTGPFNFSGGYIGKITACRECWQAILEMYEEEYQEGIVQHVGTAWQNEWAAEDDYDSTYGKEPAKIRRRLKNKLMGEATMGTKAGQWSARKSQELKRRYEAACERKGIKPYKGSKTTKQKDLSNWSKQGWRTASGRKSSDTGEPYFPTKAVKALKDKELYAKAKRQKAAATRAGKQRATYSKDIQAVVARYRAEDHTIDDLDDESLMIRMEDLAERMDAIVQRIGSYPDAERDPEYLRLVEQHTAYARVLARRHGFGAEDDDGETEYYIRLKPKFAMGYVHHHRSFSDLKDAQSAARILSLEFPAKHRGVLGITEGRGYPPKFMLTKSSCQVCGADSEDPCVCMNGPEVRPCTDKPITKWQSDSVMYQPCPCSGVTDGGFSAESDASFTPDPDLPLTKQARDQYLFMMPDGSALWIHNQDWSVSMADMKPTWDSKRLSDYGGTPTTVTYMSLGSVDPADYTDFIPEWRPGMSFPPEDMVDQWIDPSRLGEAHDELTKQYETGFWPGLSLREILGKYDGGKPVFDAEEFEYPHHDPDWLYEHHIVQGLSARKIAEMLDVPVNLITRRLHEFGLYVPGEYTADRRMTENELRRMREAESDPVSSVAAGTTDALNDFANSQDTDDKFYFIGGLVGGLAIAVLGNIISDRLQDVYFPHWWENRGGSKS